MLKAAAVLFVLAFAIEIFGPWLLKMLLPQQMLAPAPEVKAPKKTVERNDAVVDTATQRLAHLRHQRRPDGSSDDALEEVGMVGAAAVVAAEADTALAVPQVAEVAAYRETAVEALTATAPAAKVDPVDALLTGQNFDYEEFRPSYEERNSSIEDEIDRAMA